jgi:hypothetical protein
MNAAEGGFGMLHLEGAPFGSIPSYRLSPSSLPV